MNIELPTGAKSIKAISIRQPYASNILSGKKKYEFRDWQTTYRGKLIICSTKRPEYSGFLCGYALGTATIVDIIKYRSTHGRAYKDFLYSWVLESPKPFPAPVPIRGNLGLYLLNNYELKKIESNNRLSI